MIENIRNDARGFVNRALLEVLVQSCALVIRFRGANPLSDDDISLKFHSLASDLSSDRRAVIEQSVAALDTDEGALAALMAAILAPVDSSSV